MNDDHLFSPWIVKLLQLAIFLSVVFAAIWFQETYQYEINPYIMGGWGFIASYGFTLLLCRLEAFLILRRARLTGFAGEE